MMKRSIAVVLMCFMLVGCTLPGLGGSAKNQDIVVASGDTSERQIMAEMILQMMHHHAPHIKTGSVSNLGSSVLVLQSLQGEDANVSSVMYTGTSLTGELGLESTTDPEKALKAVVNGYYERFNMLWLPTYGFENTYAFTMRREDAQALGIEKISDLKAHASKMRAGVDTGWLEREGDGYRAFKELYGFDFKEVLPMQIGLVYEAVATGNMDIVLSYSTDGRIQTYDLVVLEDDMNLFPPYDAGPVMSVKLYQKHPEVLDIMLRLAHQVDTPTMQALNRQSDEDKMEPRQIAKEFLEAHDYFESVDVEALKQDPLYAEILKEVSRDE